GDPGGHRQPGHRAGDRPTAPEERDRQVLRGGHHAQAEAPRAAKGREEADEAAGSGRDPPGGLPHRAPVVGVAMAQPLNHTEPEGSPQPMAPVRRKSVVREYAEAILIAILLALLIRTFVVQAFKIPSGSMIPTLLIGDHILVNKFIYRFRDPMRGDV